ncbi:hypothetical protein KPH14_005149 [Odynerus spinipes]|uniref:Aminopeptidase n=1 Tax=Odynerus spinipes TaxID=1348599 RepID=A0AAD9RLP4_9HYME|nr:hypothetical protein KPH14_005149 [Odynerus spinipes]
MLALGDSQGKADRYKPEEINYRLPDDVRPIHYNIKLTPCLLDDDFRFDGETGIDLDVRKSTSNIALHCTGIVIDEAATSLTNLKNDRLLPIEQEYVEENELLVLRFASTLQPARYTLHLKFSGFHEEATHGFNRRSYTDEQDNRMWYAVTNFKMISARRVFPCFDEPAMKATFSISIKHRANYVALSNAPIEDRSSIDDEGNILTCFRTTPIMSTYSLAVALLPDNYVRVSNHDDTVNVWCRRSAPNVAKLIHEVTEKTKIQLEGYTGIRIPVSKIDHVLIHDHSSRSSANWGLIVYDESEVMYTEDPSDTYNVEMTTRLVTHNLVHQWFGNLVSPSWWNHWWLNEVLVYYLKYYIVDKIYEEWRALELFVVVVQQETALFTDNYSFVEYNQTNIKNHRESYFDNFAALLPKGACLMRMLSHCLREDVFHAGIVTYLTKFQYGMATLEELWKILEEIMHPEKVNLKEMMDTWIKHRGYPLVTARRDRNTGAITVMQERFKLPDIDDDEEDERDDDDARWWIPINYTSKSRANFSSTLTIHWLKPRNESLTIDDVEESDWFIINLQQTGYYRVNYDTDNWMKIAKYLDSDDYTKIHPLNRAQIIDDACYMIQTERLDPIVFLEVVKYLRHETDYIPWYAAFRALRTFYVYPQFPDGAMFFKPYILKLIDGLLKNVGYDEHPNDDDLTKLKRVEVLEIAGDLGHLESRKIANAKLIAHMDDPRSNEIPSNLNMWVFTNGMRDADESLFNKLLDRYKEKPSLSTLRYLSGVEDPTLVKRLLNLTLVNDSPILKDDRVEIYRSLMYTSSTNVDITVDFVSDNWNKITSRIEDADEIIDDIVGEITCWDQFHKVKYCS